MKLTQPQETRITEALVNEALIRIERLLGRDLTEPEYEALEESLNYGISDVLAGLVIPTP